jgi:hypothetical protein
MTVQVADAHAHVQRLVSVGKMSAVLEEYTNEEQHSVVRFLWAKGRNAKDLHKEMCYVYGGKCSSDKAAHKLGDKRFADDEEFEAEARKWLGQQSKDFCAAGFDALVTKLDKCINVGGGYVEK